MALSFFRLAIHDSFCQKLLADADRSPRTTHRCYAVLIHPPKLARFAALPRGHSLQFENNAFDLPELTLGHAFLIVVFMVATGIFLGFTLVATQQHILLFLFVGPTYLFFILVGSGLGYAVNRRRYSKADLGAWILPMIWSVFAATGDFSSSTHQGDSLLGYVWNTLILGNHAFALLSQWIIGAPLLSAVAYSFGASFAIRRPPPAYSPHQS